ncbi:MAG: hypothetical protein ACOC7V_07835 [Spirochaetota bacterium]
MIAVSVEPVNSETRREVAALRVTESQRAFVAEPAYYLRLCYYGDLWHPLAVRADIARTDSARDHQGRRAPSPRLTGRRYPIRGNCGR